MIEIILKSIRKLYSKISHGIAFLPALMAVVFIIIGVVAMELDKAGFGSLINQKVKWLTLKDPDTARMIVGTVTSGIVSLTVFSFSMVMIVMNQAASQMSNRILDNLIGNWFQKTVLGFYIGTIIYSLLILSNISEAGSDKSVPSFSIYLLILFTIIDIFLFVYFLHYITQSIRYEQLVKRIHHKTKKMFTKQVQNEKTTTLKLDESHSESVLAPETGYFQGFSTSQLLKLTIKNDFKIQFLLTVGSYVLKGVPFLTITGKKKISDDVLEKMFRDIDFYYGKEIDNNPYYGFQHLTEVAVKALSPGINDPGTAIISLNALADLLSGKLQQKTNCVIKDKEGAVRIITVELPFEELFKDSVLPIWDYGRKDRLVQKATINLLHQLKVVDKEDAHKPLFDRLIKEVKDQQENRTD